MALLAEAVQVGTKAPTVAILDFEDGVELLTPQQGDCLATYQAVAFFTRIQIAGSR